MPEISEGGTVIAPNGDVLEVIGTEDKENYVKIHVTTDGLNRGAIALDHVVSASSPIRVKVSRECYAESLVVLAEEHGFNMRYDKQVGDWPKIIAFDPDVMGETFTSRKGYDLTYQDDLPQIEGWLEANSESEDECETCGGDEYIEEEVRVTHKHTGFKTKPCPDCTDESEDYDEPKRREKPDDIRTIRWRRTPSEVKDYIHDLQSEISDCWENQQEYKNDVDRLLREKAELQEKLQDVREELMAMKRARNAWYERYGEMDEQLWERTKERDNLRKRIEEAREYLESIGRPYGCNKNVLLEILSPDSNEGDGECG